MSPNTHRAILLVIILAACGRASPQKSDDAFDQMSVSPPAQDTAAEATAAVELERRGLVAGRLNPPAAAVADRSSIPLPSPAVGEQNQSPVPSPQDIAPGSMLVRVGEASLQVDSLDAGLRRVRDLAQRTGAIVANTSREGGRDQTRAASLQLRIPSEHFDEAVSALSSVGKLESVNVTVQDVGEEFVDVSARVANARRLEQRLVDLLATRTGKLADVLSVERELARVREEIERYEGRMHYLRSRASVSTLTVAVHEPYPIVADRPGARPIRDAFVQAWRNLVGFTAGFIALLGILVPLAAVLVLLVMMMRRLTPMIIPHLSTTRATSERGTA
jgi:hypothetical protein